jgi:hypothetical protein
VDGHDIAYAKISDACSKFQTPPAFYSADSQDFGGTDPSTVPFWMHTAAQIATGGRKQVLENGADVCNSESDSENEEHGEELKGEHTADVPVDSNGQPVLGKCKLSSTQAEILRLAAQLKSRPLSDYSPSTSESSSADSEDSVHEFYRCNPQIPRFSRLVAIRKPSEDEKALIAHMIQDSRERRGKDRTVPKHPMATRSSDAVPAPPRPKSPAATPMSAPPAPSKSRAKAKPAQ